MSKRGGISLGRSTSAGAESGNIFLPVRKLGITWIMKGS